MTETALRSIFSTDAPVEEFDRNFEYPWMTTENTGWVPLFEWDVSTVEKAINVLRALIEGLEYLSPADGTVTETSTSPRGRSAVSNGEPPPVFVVHGRDDERKTQVARLLERPATIQSPSCTSSPTEDGRS